MAQLYDYQTMSCTVLGIGLNKYISIFVVCENVQMYAQIFLFHIPKYIEYKNHGLRRSFETVIHIINTLVL